MAISKVRVPCVINGGQIVPLCTVQYGISHVYSYMHVEQESYVCLYFQRVQKDLVYHVVNCIQMYYLLRYCVYEHNIQALHINIYFDFKCMLLSFLFIKLNYPAHIAHLHQPHHRCSHVFHLSHLIFIFQFPAGRSHELHFGQHHLLLASLQTIS